VTVLKIQITVRKVFEYYLTANGSQISKSFILQIFPVTPFIPKNLPSGFACFALSSVKTLTTSAPQF
jgi:hypothetical protein